MIVIVSALYSDYIYHYDTRGIVIYRCDDCYCFCFIQYELIIMTHGVSWFTDVMIVIVSASYSDYIYHYDTRGIVIYRCDYC